MRRTRGAERRRFPRAPSPAKVPRDDHHRTGSIDGRKADHIELCATGDVGFRGKTTLLEHVRLVHDALPELALDEIDTSVTLLGKKLRAPLVIAAMTGGTDAGRATSTASSPRIAEERGYGFGLGSQRAMHARRARTTPTACATSAPTALVLGNIGVVQAREMSTDAVTRARRRASAPTRSAST